MNIMYESLGKLYYKNPDSYNTVYDKRIKSDSAIHLDVNINGNKAFFLQTPDLFAKIISIISNNNNITHLSYHLPSQALAQYAKKCLVDEIIITNNIEGVHSTRKEINDILIEPENKNNKNRFIGLVNRYNMLGKQKLSLESCNDIRTIYDELVLQEILQNDKNNIPDGQFFRKSGVNVHSITDKIIHQGITPEKEIQDYMDKSLNFLNDDSINIYFRIAIFHYLFGYIHPFYDGNGRTSRFISSYLLANELNYLIGYRLSYTIKENINKYYKAFKVCNDSKNLGDLTPFIYMFLDIIDSSMDNLKKSLNLRYEKFKLYDHRIKFLPLGNNEKYYKIYNLLIQAALFSEYGISITDLIDMNEISYTTLNNRLKKIPDELIIIKHEKKSKFYSLNLEYVDKLISQSAPSDN